MKRNILKFLFSLIVIISGVTISLIHANEEDLITPERAYDYSYNYLDDGVGKFIGKTTDVENQEIDCPLRGENLYIFQYLRKDTKFPIHGEYVIVNINSIPDYVDYDSENYFAIKDTYWYFAKTMTESVKIDTIAYFDLESNSATAKLYVYLNFGDYTIDQINKIHIKYQLCYKEKYGFLWLKTRYVFEDFEHIITADSYEDFSSENISANVLILKNNYDLDGNSTLETLDTPVEIENKIYTHRVYALNIITTKEYYLSAEDERKTELDIVEMYYIQAGVLCWSEDFEIIENNYSDKNTEDDKSWLEKNINTISIVINIILFILIIILLVIIIRNIYYKSNYNRKKE